MTTTTHTLMRRGIQTIAATLCAACLALPVAAQGQFNPAVKVNDSVVTNFEIAQRQRLMTLLRQPGTSRNEVADILIADRLKIAAATQAGIEPTEQEVDLAVEDFAGRANLSGTEFLQALGESGIASETIRDFLRVQLAWGDLVRTQFASRARPSDAEIDRAMSLGTGQSSARVLLSEIILPLAPQIAEQSQQRAEAISQMTSFSEFENAARNFSAAPTRENGGRLDWMPLSDLPPQIGPVFLTMAPGEVTDPIPLGEAIALFQFRGLQDSTPSQAANPTIEYSRIFFPAGTDLATERARLTALADNCVDLFGLFPNSDPNRLINESRPQSQLPSDLRAIVGRLDPGEMTILPATAAGTPASIAMLCSRDASGDIDLTRDEVGQQLFLRRLNDYAEGYLAELEADAFIERY
ncbi:peptidylprolyl isomerase [Qingshengfaniella alkalisoli]|nr:peptidylprolyl isomerase [Qingshengfaniella alkalisoli]